MRNNSLNKRFILLRFVANRSTLPAIITPNLAHVRLLGFAKTCKNSLLARHLKRIIEENSSALCNLWLFGKK